MKHPLTYFPFIESVFYSLSSVRGDASKYANALSITNFSFETSPRQFLSYNSVSLYLATSAVSYSLMGKHTVSSEAANHANETKTLEAANWVRQLPTSG